MERFFKSYQEERIGNQTYDTRAATITPIQEYMKYYNSVRWYSTLGYLTPVEYENGPGNVPGLG